MNGIRLMHEFFAFIQARTTSSRLPKKVLKEIPENSGLTILDHIYGRLLQILPAANIVYLIPDTDIELEEFLKKRNYQYHKGSESDVRERFILAAERFNAENIIRLTGDNPFIDIEHIELLINTLTGSNYDIASFKDLPIGTGVEVFTRASLLKEPPEGLLDRHREHVSLHIKESASSKFYKFDSLLTAEEKAKLPFMRITIDEEPDFQFCTWLLENLKQINPYFGVKEIFSLYGKNPEGFKINEKVEQITFKVKEPITSSHRITILYADPARYGSGHYERCKLLYTLLQLNGFHCVLSDSLENIEQGDFYIIDHRDTEVPNSIKREKLLLIDNFGPDREHFPHIDVLPHPYNLFENVLEHILLPTGINNYVKSSFKKKITCYAGSLNSEDSYYLDLFLYWQFHRRGYEIVRIGGSVHKKVLGIEYFSRLSTHLFISHISESEFFISYFGQSIFTSAFFNNKVLLIGIGDVHEELGIHLSQNSNAIYAGNLKKRNLNLICNFAKNTRPIDISVTDRGYFNLINLIQSIGNFNEI